MQRNSQFIGRQLTKWFWLVPCLYHEMPSMFFVFSTFLFVELGEAEKNRLFLVAYKRLYTPLCSSVRWSVGRSVGWSVRHTLLFFMILFLWPHCSCPNGLVTSNMAPAHPNATSVAVYPAVLNSWIALFITSVYLAFITNTKFRDVMLGA